MKKRSSFTEIMTPLFWLLVVEITIGIIFDLDFAPLATVTYFFGIPICLLIGFSEDD